MIAEDRPCRACGYNLRGLFIGGNCPECGRIIGAGRSERQSNLIDAPKSWLIVLAAGLVTMCGAWAVLLGLLLVAHRWMPTTFDAQLVIGCIVGGMWTLGTLIVLRERPRELRPKDVEASEATRASMLRVSAGLTQAAIVPAFVFDNMRLSGGHPLLGYLAMAFGAAAIVGQVPLCYWLARVCEWSDDDLLARRFRNLGWCVAFVTLLNILMEAFRVSGIPPLRIVATWGLLFQLAMVFTILAVIVSIAQMSWDIRWIFRNAARLAERDENRAARAAAEARRYAESAERAKPAALSPESARLMRESLTPEGDQGASYTPSSLPPPGVRPLNERVIPKATEGGYRLEGDPGRTDG